MKALALLLGIVSTLLLVGCNEEPSATAKASQPPPPPVTVAKPLKKRITEWDEFTGRFEAVETVDVRARVSGFLDRIHFRDGQIVKKGELLFTIDKRPFEIAVEQAKAQVDQAQAQLDLANSDVERARPLLERRTITGREFESREATARGALASLSEARAQLKNAELNLEWTEVDSPITGRISDTPIDVGNLIAGGQNGATVLTRIVSLDPIHFEFEGSEADYLKYTRLARSGQRPSSRDSANPVAVRLIDEQDFRHRGNMDFVDNAIDPRSGTIKGRAIFENKDTLLLPGMFGRMRLFGGDFDAILIPDDAIASDQARKIVMSVTPDGEVTPKVVTLGPMVFGLRVVRTGLSASDQIIISGMQRARPGQKVKPEVGEIAAEEPQTN